MPSINPILKGTWYLIMDGLEIRIKGRVQGVFFRANTKEQANRLGIKGWVRNEPDGGVLIRAEGNKENLNKLLKWCRKGPEMARVDDVNFNWIESDGNFASFEIRS